jgi:hypothetical protein
MQDRSDENHEFHVPADTRTLEDITRRLQEMQRELDERAPVHPHEDDGPADPAAA